MYFISFPPRLLFYVFLVVTSKLSENNLITLVKTRSTYITN